MTPYADRKLAYLLATLFFALAVACGGSVPPGQAPAAQSEVDLESADDAAIASGPTSGEAPHSQRSAAVASSGIVPVEDDDAVWGDDLAPVTMVAFLDYECPFCARVHPTLVQLKERYGPSKLRVVWKHNPLPFHKRALPAARAAQAVLMLAGDAAFFSYSRRLFENHRDLSESNLATWASEVGAPRDAFDDERSSDRVVEQVDRDVELARATGLNGTPSFLINGKKTVGAQPYDEFADVIDQELEAADRLAADGAAPETIYATRVADNFVRPSEADERRGARPARRPAAPPDTTVHKVPIGSSPQRGPKNALVTIVAFMDFQCPFCGRVVPTLERVMTEYKNDVRIVFKHNALAFHKRAIPAAMLAIEAHKQRGDAGFWDAHDRLFASQQKLEDADLEAIAKDMRLALWRVRRAIHDEKHKRIVEDDMDLAHGINARGTPAFFINGIKLSGAQPFAKFAELIEAQRDKAKDLVAKGTSRATVYEAIMKDAKGPPPPERKTVPKGTNKNPSRGVAWAPVTIQVFSDFECPFCKRAKPTLEAIEKEFKSKVRVVWRNMPLSFHKNARPAAVAAMEAFAQGGAKKFWKMHDLLFENQDGPDGLNEAALVGYAKTLGLNITKLEAALGDGRHDAAIDADLAIAKAAGIRGAPGFVVNGYFISGAQPLSRFRKVVRLALDDAKKGKKP